MNSRARVLISVSALAVAAAGFYAYSVLAVQGAGTLAQAPLNIEANVKPAFVMAVDDSNSMTFERLFAGGDGRLQWNSANGSFFSGAGVYHDVGDPCANGSVDCYLYLYPHSGFNSSYSPGDALPPLDAFGFARSPAYNKTYFNPATTYEPWKNADGTLWPNATATATRADPRTGGTFATANGVVYDLTADRRVNGENFSVLSGMTVPAGTVYRSTSAICGNSNATRLPDTDGDWESLNSARTVNQNCTVNIGYFPATFYLPASAAAPAGYRTGDAYRPVIADACGPGCDLRRYEIRPANYTSAADYNAAIQNFANWFQYHRSRLLATVGSMTHSLVGVTNMRVGYFTINNRVNAVMRDMAIAADKSSLYSSVVSLQAGLLALGSGGGTPNRSAAKFLGEQFKRTDSGAPVQLSCQRNAGMLFTDGYTNDTDDISGIGNADGGMGSPFADSYSDTIADVAAYYYSGGGVPLRTGTGFPAGKVGIPEECSTLNPSSAAWKKLDCQSNLHMNFYGITLGAQGRIHGVNASATNDPYANPPGWDSLSNPSTVNDGTVIDEIWHGALNSRGEFINASTPADVTDAMRRVISAASGGRTPSGSLGLTGARIATGSFTVVPRYNSLNNGTDWYSTLTAQSVSSDVLTGAVTYTTLWEASAALPAASGRTIFRGKATGAIRPDVAPFDVANVAVADLCGDSLSTCTENGSNDGIVGASSKLKITAAEAIAYLRGDQTLETSTTTPLRRRSGRLGDIVNSTPVVTSPFLDHGYQAIRTISGGTTTYPFKASYKAFLDAKATSVPAVYAGANDGMLHAFNGTSGAEMFAYVPVTALGHMGNLLFPYEASRRGDQLARHKYYVDGPTTVADAYYGGNWHTVLVGTAGAGGRGVFGLNVTTPTSFTASDVLWEVNDRVTATAVRNNIGHVLGKPVILPMMDATGVRWKAVFGNGYNSNNQDAVLFVVDIQNGAVETIRAEESARASIANGLGNVIAIDRWVGRTKGAGEVAGRDGLADTVYAGDQNGAVWKFDLRDNSVSSTPFFIAQDASGARQPILGGFDAAAGPGGGVMLYFGTGSFSFEGDKTDDQLQSFYGVLDRGTSVTRSQLVRQTITEAGSVRSVSSLASAGAGWYVDLGVTTATATVSSGERAVGYPRVENGIVFFTTYAPQSASDCAGDGLNRLYGLGALSGASAMSQVRFGTPDASAPAAGQNGFLLDTGGSAPVKDVAVLSTPRQQPLAATATAAQQAAALAARCSMVVQVAGAPPGYMPRACGRQSWRQVR